MSQFGICYNPDVLTRLGIEPPVSWRCLADPRYAGTIALADPTKSGSVARTFELIVQSEILRALKENPDEAARDATIAAGWTRGLQLIRKMAANDCGSENRAHLVARWRVRCTARRSAAMHNAGISRPLRDARSRPLQRPRQFSI